MLCHAQQPHWPDASDVRVVCGLCSGGVSSRAQLGVWPKDHKSKDQETEALWSRKNVLY